MKEKEQNKGIIYAVIGILIVVLAVGVIGMLTIGTDHEEIQGEIEVEQYRVSSKIPGRILEICVKEAKPKAIMTSYNRLNGIHTSENAELLTGILRKEWGYKGLVMTDWGNSASHKKELLAGNDVRMPYTAGTDIDEALKTGEITRNELYASVKRVLEFIMWFDN